MKGGLLLQLALGLGCGEVRALNPFWLDNEKSGQGGILSHENDWLTVNHALDRATRPRGGYER